MFSGGTFAYGIYGGCFTGQVTGFSKVIVTGGNFSGTIYGGGFGKKCGQGDSRDANLGKVGKTEVHVSGLTNEKFRFWRRFVCGCDREYPSYDKYRKIQSYIW